MMLNITGLKTTSRLKNITGLILAGGQARRMGGHDKGLLPLQGQPLITHVIARLHPQVQRLYISANRNLSHYQSFGFPVLTDSMPDFVGPLAGILSGLQQLNSDALATDYLLVVPCDTPCLPKNLAQHLWQARQAKQTRLSVAHDGQRWQPTFALLHHSLQTDLQDYLRSGERRLQAWLLSQNAAQADFSAQPEAFINLNRPEDWEILQDEKFAISSTRQSPPSL